jgi:molybdopterin-containing oxidoreductase family iron-sulfur binding subunit
MVIDLMRCIGCHTCSVSCRISKNLPNNNWWNRVLTVGGQDMDTPSGIYPDVKMGFLPISCQHCENPPCVAACPTGASYKREEDGVVLVDGDKCIGCRLCMVACPYNARSFNWQEPEYYLEHAVGDVDAPAHQFNTVEKCTFCVNRLARGEKPACMELCPGRARFWGDLDDPESEVSKIMRGRETVRLLEDKGTGPAVYYLK